MRVSLIQNVIYKCSRVYAFTKFLNYFDVIEVRTIVNQCEEMSALILDDCFLSHLYLIHLISFPVLVLLV